MTNPFALAIVPLVALGCCIYAVWAVYCSWKERADAPPKRRGRRRREHPMATVIQGALTVGLGIALLSTGLSILGSTLGDSPYAGAFSQPSEEDPCEHGPTHAPLTEGLRGSFEIAWTDPSKTVLGANLTHLSRADTDVANLLQRCPELEWLHLHSTDVTDEAVTQLQHFAKLRQVTLSQTSIGNKSLSALVKLDNLMMLHLRQTEVSDAGIRHLKRLSSLEHLDLRETAVTRKAARKLQKSLPDCNILI